MRELWILPEVWDMTLDLMRPYAEREVEAGCFWYGIRTDAAAFAVAVGVPKQINRRRNFEITSDALAELVGSLPAPDLVAVAQIHTHPGEETDHSIWDDDLVVSRKIYAIVLPWYGRQPCPLGSAGVHRLINDEWRQLSPAEVAAQIHMLPTALDTRG